MPPENVVDRVIGDIADGRPVDWAVLDAEVRTDADRSWARALRILQEIADAHRADDVSDEEGSVSDGATVEQVVQRLPDGTPREWGKYRLEHKLGEGSFGRVYSAWDRELERHVAIKVLHRTVADAHRKDRLLREGRALAKVRHPHVVSVFGMEAHGDQVGLCMEFIRGETLANVVRRHGTLSARETVLIGEDLCRALAAVHRAGFVHRDIKARNVMREEAGRIVLMDFGTGREAARPELPGEMAGTPLYMAPEVLGGESASARSDVYSLGVLLYHLVTASYPVEGRTMDQVLEAHVQRRRTLLSERRPDLPLSFIRVVEKATAIDPDERYASAGELLQALDALDLTERSRTRQLARWAVVAGVAVLGMMMLGAITSARFNHALERAGFVDETPWDWLVWGRRSSLPPFVILVMVTLIATVVVTARRLVVWGSASARRWEAAASRSAANAVQRWRLDDVNVLGSVALLVSSIALGAAWWYFSPLIVATLTFVSTAPVEELRLLAPDQVTYHNYYRGVFTLVVILSVAVWLPVIRLSRKGRLPHWGVVLGGAVVTSLAIALLHLPYRLLYFNDDVFDAVRWRSMHCYIVGEREQDVLLFCPDAESPRIRTVAKGTDAFEPLGTRESIFSRFGASSRVLPAANP